jgi:uncharacterized membrane protein YbhN (UPF0104 family)
VLSAPHLSVRLWSSATDARRYRQPTDVLLLAVSAVLLVLLALVAPGPTAVDDALTNLLAQLDPLLGWLWSLAYTLLALWAVLLLVLAAVRRGRRSLLRDYLLAAALAFLVAVGLSLLAGTDGATNVESVLASGPPAVFLATRVAMLCAVIVTASPHLSRPLRYVGRTVIGFGAVAAVGLGVSEPIGAFAGIAVGVAAAAATHLVLGSPQGRLTAEQLRHALLDLDVPVGSVERVEAAARDDAGFLARTGSGEQLLVKVRGRDAWDSQVVGSLWTALTTRGEVPRLVGTRRARVEHEALATLLAERAGVPVLPVVAVGLASQGDALLVTTMPESTLAAVDPGSVQDSELDGLWHALQLLHGARIAHGQVNVRHLVRRQDGTPALAGFDAARLAADPADLHTDDARLLVATTILVGPERAVAAASRAVGVPALVDLLPYLQPAALGRETKAALRGGALSLDDLRARAATAAGVEPPPLERLQRVTVASAVKVGLVALIAYVVVSTLAGVDLSSVWAALGSASWTWLVAALLLSPTIQAALALSTLGASLTRLRYLPVLMLQYAIQFIAVVLPATAARLALEVRFFERFGVAPGAAMTIGVIDSLSGFAIQMLLILVILVSGLPGFTSPLGAGSGTSDAGSGPSVLVIAAVLVVVGLVVAVAVPRIRHRLTALLPRIRAALVEQAHSARSQLGVLKRPAKVGTMLAGNLGAQLLQAGVLGLCLAAFGESAHFAQLILINTAVSLFAGLMPVPGGMGVAEAGYTAGLQAVGVPSAVAISVAITFRMATFYLPPLWGSLSMRWLRRREYV